MARCSFKIWGSARKAAISTSSARATAICFSAAKCSLRSWLYCVHHGLGKRLFGGGVGDLGGRCRARARRSGHVRCGRRRRMGVGCGLPAWIGEAEQREGGSPARRRRRCKHGVKVSTWKGRRKGGK